MKANGFRFLVETQRISDFIKLSFLRDATKLQEHRKFESQRLEKYARKIIKIESRYH
jgi:hypothetical protein